MVVNSPPVPVNKQPKDLLPFNTTGAVQNTPEDKRKRMPPVLYIQEGIEQSTTSPLLLDIPSPLQKIMALLDDQPPPHDFIGDPVCQLVSDVQWYGNVISSRMFDEKTKLWTVRCDNTDTEEKTLKQVIALKKRYERQKQYDTEANSKLPATTTAPTLPRSKKKKKESAAKNKALPSAKKKKTPVKPKKKKPLTEKQKKALAERLPPPKLLNNNGNTVITNDNYTRDEPYPYHVQYKDESTPLYEPIKLDNHFVPKFALPYGTIPLVNLMSMLSLPNKLIDTIAQRSTMYARSRSHLPIMIPVNENKPQGELKKNPSYLSTSKFKPITRQDILYFLACYYYMGYCRLPARRDYWRRQVPNSCVPSHWMDGTISRDKFEYLWRNISLSNDGDDDDDIDINVSDEADGEFVDDHDYAAHNNDSSDDDDSSDEEEEEEDDDDNADGSIDYDTVVDDDDDDESWYKKASFMIDWTNKFSRTYCVHPGFAISIDEMMKLFKGRSNMTHIMKCKPIPKGYKFYAMCCAQSGYCFFFFPDGLKDKKKRMIHEGVVWCVRHLPDRKKKQYVVVMDNYFTMTKKMIGTCKCGVAIMGTARGRPGWPPKEIGKKSIQDK